ncbi:unnamed protein product, partial [marine sediment metagenome]
IKSINAFNNTFVENSIYKNNENGINIENSNNNTIKNNNITDNLLG